VRRVGYDWQVVLHYQSLTEQAHLRHLISQLHRNTGEVVKKKPRSAHWRCVTLYFIKILIA